MAITKYPPSPRSVIHHVTDIEQDEASADKTAAAPCLPNPCKRRARRTVCINESANVEYVNTVWTKEDTATLWYSRHELRHCKAQYRDLVQQISQREAAMMHRCSSSWGNCLMRVHELCSNNNSSSCNDACDNILSLVNEVDRAVILCRLQQSHGRVGLVDAAVPGLAAERSWRRRQVIMVARMGCPSPSLSQPSTRMAHVLATLLQESLQDNNDHDDI